MTASSLGLQSLDGAWAMVGLQSAETKHFQEKL